MIQALESKILKHSLRECIKWSVINICILALHPTMKMTQKWATIDLFFLKWKKKLDMICAAISEHSSLEFLIY